MQGVLPHSDCFTVTIDLHKKFITKTRSQQNKTIASCLPISIYFGSKGVPIELQRTSTYCMEIKASVITTTFFVN